jgi:hypothetical protein
MRILILILTIFLSACSSSSVNKNNNYLFSTKMNIIEFKTILGEYAKNSPYPNIDD